MQANYKNVATQSFYVAGYFQDDWRVTPKLSLSLGPALGHRHAAHGALQPHQLSSTRSAATPAAQVIPGITGGLVFVGVNGAAAHAVQRRHQQLGAALRPELAVRAQDRLRLGYAHIFGPSQQAAAGTIGTMGFRVDNTWVATIDGITPNDLLRNPYPRGVAARRRRRQRRADAVRQPHRGHHAGHRLAA